jgi:hypothetical protein
VTPSSLPLELWMKWVLAQAGHATGEWLSFASSGTSASLCCTFIPVWGHLKTMGLSMIGTICQCPSLAKTPDVYLGPGLRKADEPSRFRPPAASSPAALPHLLDPLPLTACRQCSGFCR